MLLIVQPLGLLEKAAPWILVTRVLVHAVQEEVPRTIFVIGVVFVILVLRSSSRR